MQTSNEDRVGINDHQSHAPRNYQTHYRHQIAESGVAVELDVQAHEEKSGSGEDGLPESQSQAGTGSQRPRQFIHACNCMQQQQELLMANEIQEQFFSATWPSNYEKNGVTK